MFRRLETAAVYENPEQAHIARGRLIADGVEAHLWDEHIVAVNWIWSNAVHGVKLKVPEHLVQEAEELLDDDYRDLLLEQEDGVEALACCRCGSKSFAPYQPRRIFAALFLFPLWSLVLLAGLPFIKWKAHWRCLSCNAKLP